MKIPWDGETPLDAAVIMRIINKSMSLGLWDQLDYMIATAPIETASSVMLVALLRGSFRYKSVLPSWHITVKMADREFKFRGRDTAKLMEGLL